jgi:hypothetical protein
MSVTLVYWVGNLTERSWRYAEIAEKNPTVARTFSCNP